MPSALSRRGFLQTGLAAGAILTLPAATYRAVFAADTKPSDSVRVGIIGSGLQGRANMGSIIKNVVAVCEGEIDTIVMHSLVGIPAVGVPGAQHWKPHYRLLLEDFEHVVVMCDGDQAGREFGRKVVSDLDNATAVHLPDGVDVNEAYLSHGTDWIKAKAGI